MSAAWHIVSDVADPIVLVSRVSPEGRVVIPAEVRRQLGVGPGDLVQFVVQADGAIELATAKMLIEAVWANNRGGDRLDSTEAVRSDRLHDLAVEAAAEGRIAAEAEADEPWHEERETGRLLAALGLDQ